MIATATPAWVQWVAAVTSIVVAMATLGLAVLTGVYVRHTGNLTDTAERQLAAAAADRRLERVKIARILTEETKRLRKALGDPETRVTDVRDRGVVFEVPSVHEWVRGMVPEGALVSADVVGGFLTLEREFNRARSLQESLKNHAYLAALASRPAEGASKSLQDTVKQAENKVSELLEALNACVGLLDDLDRRLLPVAREETVLHA